MMKKIKRLSKSDILELRRDHFGLSLRTANAAGDANHCE